MTRSLVLATFALASVAVSAQDEGHATRPGEIEGRPAGRQTSTLQARIDATPAGGTLVVDSGSYEGDLVIDKPLRLIGRGRPRLVGSGTGSVVRVRAPEVLIEGFDIDGRRGGDLGRDTSGVHVAARNVTVRDCRISDAIFGVYLREADAAVVERCSVRGIAGREPGEKGSGIHVWNTTGFRILDNTILDVRDGLYVQSSSHGLVKGNRASELRYGLHYMFSDDNVFEDNVFENGAAGAALMYSKRIAFRRNQFLRNRGFASVGLLLKACDDVVAEDNLIADNARGIFIEGSYRNLIRRNVIAGSDIAIVLYDSSSGNRFLGNSFVGNLSPLTLVGRRTDTVFSGNYYSDNHEPDLDGDGIADRAYRLSSVFDHLRGNLIAADLLAQSLAASALGAAEQAFPVLRAVPVEDQRALARPPALPDVPTPEPRRRVAGLAGISGSALALSLGFLTLLRGRA